MGADPPGLTLLQSSLSCAVPLWILELRQKPYEELLVMAREAAQIVASKGDVILYRGKKPGESAEAFNALARGLAILAFSPGGVTLFGLHFEECHPELIYEFHPSPGDG